MITIAALKLKGEGGLAGWVWADGWTGTGDVRAVVEVVRRCVLSKDGGGVMSSVSEVMQDESSREEKRDGMKGAARGGQWVDDVIWFSEQSLES